MSSQKDTTHACVFGFQISSWTDINNGVSGMCVWVCVWHVNAKTGCLVLPTAVSFHPDLFLSYLHLDEVLFLSNQRWPRPSPLSNAAIFSPMPRLAGGCCWCCCCCMDTYVHEGVSAALGKCGVYTPRAFNLNIYNISLVTVVTRAQFGMNKSYRWDWTFCLNLKLWLIFFFLILHVLPQWNYA